VKATGPAGETEPPSRRPRQAAHVINYILRRLVTSALLLVAVSM